MRKFLLVTLSLVVLVTSAESVPVAAVDASSRPLTEKERAVAKAAFETLKSMPKKERKEKLKEAKKEIKKFKAARKAGKEADTNTLLLVILALLLPPLAVYLHQQETNTKFWVTLLLFLLGIAGAFFFSWLLIFASVVYALIIILSGA
jgi:uncharacterized membrane protein YqaE (UPF0057 family)